MDKRFVKIGVITAAIIVVIAECFFLVPNSFEKTIDMGEETYLAYAIYTSSGFKELNIGFSPFMETFELVLEEDDSELSEEFLKLLEQSRYRLSMKNLLPTREVSVEDSDGVVTIGIAGKEKGCIITFLGEDVVNFSWNNQRNKIYRLVDEEILREIKSFIKLHGVKTSGFERIIIENVDSDYNMPIVIPYGDERLDKAETLFANLWSDKDKLTKFNGEIQEESGYLISFITEEEAEKQYRIVGKYVQFDDSETWYELPDAAAEKWENIIKQ